jgi:hypothetical protein
MILFLVLMFQGKDALRDYTWNVTTLNHQSYHMGDGWCPFALLIVTQREQCAFVEKVQNIQIVLQQRLVGFN